jgi:hypothetical protein
MVQIGSRRERHWIERRYRRYKVDLPFRARLFIDESMVTNLTGRCRELGRGGLGAQLRDPLRVGETALIELSRSVSTYGVVRYVKGNYHGFEFILMQNAARAHVDKMCASCEEMSGS